MKTTVGLLVAANLLALAWWQGWLEKWVAPSREPSRVESQIAPERLRVVPVERLDAALAAARNRCLEIGPLEDAALQRIAGWVANLGERAQGELARPIYRITLIAPIDDAELKKRSDELALLGGREPVPCAAAASAADPPRSPAAKR